MDCRLVCPEFMVVFARWSMLAWAPPTWAVSHVDRAYESPMRCAWMGHVVAGSEWKLFFLFLRD